MQISVRPIILLFACAVSATSPALALDSLSCDLSRIGSELPGLSLSSPISDSVSVVQETKNALDLRIDASLAPSSFIFVMQDDAKKQRIAFTGAPTSLAWEGGKISSNSSALGCRKKSSDAPKIVSTPKNKAPYMVCVLDEALFENGQLTKSTRILQTVSSTLTFRLPLSIKAETEKYSFAVTASEFDPLKGLDVQLTDKTNGEKAAYLGPPRSLVNSFMFGFTQGDKESSAKFLRLGCVYTAEPKLFLENMKQLGDL